MFEAEAKYLKEKEKKIEKEKKEERRMEEEKKEQEEEATRLEEIEMIEGEIQVMLFLLCENQLMVNSQSLNQLVNTQTRSEHTWLRELATARADVASKEKHLSYVAANRKKLVLKKSTLKRLNEKKDLTRLVKSISCTSIHDEEEDEENEGPNSSVVIKKVSMNQYIEKTRKHYNVLVNEECGEDGIERSAGEGVRGRGVAGGGSGGGG